MRSSEFSCSLNSLNAMAVINVANDNKAPKVCFETVLCQPNLNHSPVIELVPIKLIIRQMIKDINV